MTPFQKLLAELEHWRSVFAAAPAESEQRTDAGTKIDHLEQRLAKVRRAGSQRAPLQVSTNPHLGTRRTTHVYPKGGAFHRPSRNDDRAEGGRREGTTIHEQRAQDRRVRDFVAALTGEERALAEQMGLDRPIADHFHSGGPAREETPEDPTRPATCGSHNGRPILTGDNSVLETLEPQRSSVELEELSEGEIAEAHDAFGRGLAWVHEAQHLVKKGRRLAVFIALTCPHLALQLSTPEPGLRAELAARLDGEPRLLGIVFSRVFAWCREAGSVSALGLRGDIIGYVIRPALLDAATNAQLGSPTNCTRQAVNKLVQEFRDTFAGIRAPAMRGENTRARCRAAQLS